MCYVNDGLEGITSETNAFACHLPSVFILLPSRALGNNGNVFSATMIIGVTSSGALSDLPGLAINWYTELRIFTLATSFLMLFPGALAVHFIRAMFLFSFFTLMIDSLRIIIFNYPHLWKNVTHPVTEHQIFLTVVYLPVINISFESTSNWHLKIPSLSNGR